MRYVRSKVENKDGNYIHSSNNAGAFSIIAKIAEMLSMKNHRVFRAPTLFLTCTVLLTQAAIAEERFYECDQTVKIKITTESQSQDKWIEFHKSGWKLTSIGFAGNEPSKLEDLKPYDIKQFLGSKKVTWLFEGDYPEGKWMSCAYHDLAIIRSMRIDDNAKSCSVTYRTGDRSYLVEYRVSCEVG